MCVSVWLCVHVNAVARGGQKIASEPLKLESSERAVYTPNPEPSLQAPYLV